MKKFLCFALSLAASPAFAHSSAAPHEHPHATSAYAGFDTFALVIVALGVGYTAWLWMRSR